MMIVPPPTPSSQHAAKPATLLARLSGRERSTTELIRVVCVPPIPMPAGTAASRKSRALSATARIHIPTASATSKGVRTAAGPQVS